MSVFQLYDHVTCWINQKKCPIGFDSMHGDVWKAARAFEGE
jgi:hypothetical protein